MLATGLFGCFFGLVVGFGVFIVVILFAFNEII
jgi:hypothetical protein